MVDPQLPQHSPLPLEETGTDCKGDVGRGLTVSTHPQPSLDRTTLRRQSEALDETF